jgi:hypothetical protein
LLSPSLVPSTKSCCYALGAPFSAAGRRPRRFWLGAHRRPWRCGPRAARPKSAIKSLTTPTSSPTKSWRRRSWSPTAQLATTWARRAGSRSRLTASCGRTATATSWCARRAPPPLDIAMAGYICSLGRRPPLFFPLSFLLHTPCRCAPPCAAPASRRWPSLPLLTRSLVCLSFPHRDLAACGARRALLG